MRVRLTVKCKLDVPQSALDSSDETFSRYRDACQYMSGVAFQSRTFGKVRLHHATYYPVRERTGLPAQLVCTARDKVSEAYKRDKSRRYRFKRDAVRLDARTFRLYAETERGTFTTAHGRVKASLLIGGYQRQLLSTWTTTGAADLVRQRNTLYMHIVVYRDFDEPEAANDYLGVDLGIRNLASSSDGQTITGEAVDKVRTRYAKLRQRLQAKGTRSAKRKLKRIAGREQRFQREVNNRISKSVIESASTTNRGIAIEDLSGIRERMKVRKAGRRRQHSWAFADLREKLSYKAAIAGVDLAKLLIRPIPRRGAMLAGIARVLTDRAGAFRCRQCGHADNADINAAKNIRAVNRPTVACVDSSTHSYKITALAVGS